MSSGGWTRLLVGGVVCCSLAACGGNDRKASTKSAIKIGSDVEYAPIEFFKEGTQEVQGVDYDLAQALGKVLAVKVTFINDTDFAGMITSLQNGRYDIVMSAMSDTKERQGKGVDFVDYLLP